VNTRDGGVYALEGLTTTPRLRQLGHDVVMFPHAFECSDDGELLMMAGVGVTVWDCRGKELWRQRVLHVTCGQFIPGTWQVICALNDGPVVELDAVTGEIQRYVMQGSRRIRRLSISADGKLLATRDMTGICTLHDLRTNSQRGEVFVENAIGDVQFTADGSRLVLSNPQCGVQWAAFSTESLRLERAGPGRSGPLTGLRLDSNGRVYVWNQSPTIGVWDIDTGDLVEQLTYRLPEENWPWRVYREWLSSMTLTAAVTSR